MERCVQYRNGRRIYTNIGMHARSFLSGSAGDKRSPRADGSRASCVTVQPGRRPVSSVRNRRFVSSLAPVGAPTHDSPLLTGLCAANRSPDGSLAQSPAKTLRVLDSALRNEADALHAASFRKAFVSVCGATLSHAARRIRFLKSNIGANLTLGANYCMPVRNRKAMSFDEG